MFSKSNPSGSEWKKVPDLLRRTSLNSNVLKVMISKGILEDTYFREDRLLYDFYKKDKLTALSKNQKTSLLKIESAFDCKDIVLFQGVTGSGKTEIYMKLISKAIERGDQVLYMLPEISLWTLKWLCAFSQDLVKMLLFIIPNFLYMKELKFGIMF